MQTPDLMENIFRAPGPQEELVGPETKATNAVQLCSVPTFP